MPTYRVTLHREAARALTTLPAHIQNAARTFIRDILQETPLIRIPQKTKKLKGEFAGMIQYDLPSGYRLWYRVDEAAHTVSVEYIGPHP